MMCLDWWNKLFESDVKCTFNDIWATQNAGFWSYHIWFRLENILMNPSREIIISSREHESFDYTGQKTNSIVKFLCNDHFPGRIGTWKWSPFIRDIRWFCLMF
jgi:hypothetical protein